MWKGRFAVNMNLKSKYFKYEAWTFFKLWLSYDQYDAITVLPEPNNDFPVYSWKNKKSKFWLRGKNFSNSFSR